MQLEPVELSFDNAEAVKQRGYDFIAGFSTDDQSGPICIDAGQLTGATSVSIAVFSAWHRRAACDDKSIVFMNLSQELRNIIAFSGLDEVLDLG